MNRKTRRKKTTRSASSTPTHSTPPASSTSPLSTSPPRADKDESKASVPGAGQFRPVEPAEASGEVQEVESVAVSGGGEGGGGGGEDHSSDSESDSLVVDAGPTREGSRSSLLQTPEKSSVLARERTPTPDRATAAAVAAETAYALAAVEGGLPAGGSVHVRPNRSRFPLRQRAHNKTKAERDAEFNKMQYDKRRDSDDDEDDEDDEDDDTNDEDDDDEDAKSSKRKAKGTPQGSRRSSKKSRASSSSDDDEEDDDEDDSSSGDSSDDDEEDGDSSTSGDDSSDGDDEDEDEDDEEMVAAQPAQAPQPDDDDDASVATEVPVNGDAEESSAAVAAAAEQDDDGPAPMEVDQDDAAPPTPEPSGKPGRTAKKKAKAALSQQAANKQPKAKKARSATSRRGGSKKKRKKGGSAAAAANASAQADGHGGVAHGDEGEELYCICRQPYDANRFMVGCDVCNDWFHPQCINTTITAAQKMSSFVCPKCTKKEVERHNANLPRDIDMDRDGTDSGRSSKRSSRSNSRQGSSGRRSAARSSSRKRSSLSRRKRSRGRNRSARPNKRSREFTRLISLAAIEAELSSSADDDDVYMSSDEESLDDVLEEIKHLEPTRFPDDHDDDGDVSMDAAHPASGSSSAAASTSAASSSARVRRATRLRRQGKSRKAMRARARNGKRGSDDAELADGGRAKRQRQRATQAALAEAREALPEDTGALLELPADATPQDRSRIFRRHLYARATVLRTKLAQLKHRELKRTRQLDRALQAELTDPDRFFDKDAVHPPPEHAPVHYNPGPDPVGSAGAGAASAARRSSLNLVAAAAAAAVASELDNDASDVMRSDKPAIISDDNDSDSEPALRPDGLRLPLSVQQSALMLGLPNAEFLGVGTTLADLSMIVCPSCKAVLPTHVFASHTIQCAKDQALEMASRHELYAPEQLTRPLVQGGKSRSAALQDMAGTTITPRSLVSERAVSRSGRHQRNYVFADESIFRPDDACYAERGCCGFPLGGDEQPDQICLKRRNECTEHMLWDVILRQKLASERANLRLRLRVVEQEIANEEQWAEELAAPLQQQQQQQSELEQQHQLQLAHHQQMQIQAQNMGMVDDPHAQQLLPHEELLEQHRQQQMHLQVQMQMQMQMQMQQDGQQPQDQHPQQQQEEDEQHLHSQQILDPQTMKQLLLQQQQFFAREQELVHNQMILERQRHQIDPNDFASLENLAQADRHHEHEVMLFQQQLMQFRQIQQYAQMHNLQFQQAMDQQQAMQHQQALEQQRALMQQQQQMEQQQQQQMEQQQHHHHQQAQHQEHHHQPAPPQADQNHQPQEPAAHEPVVDTQPPLANGTYAHGEPPLRVKIIKSTMQIVSPPPPGLPMQPMLPAAEPAQPHIHPFSKAVAELSGS